MNIYIITIHCIHNFGSVFQSYGLVKFLRDNGYNAKIIDYQPFYYRKGRNKFKKYASIALNPISYLKQHKKYASFINAQLHLTAKIYHSFEDLKELQADNAVFIAGGDQIWNSFHPCGRDDSYKLMFVNGKLKIAYGTSMGRNSFSKDELTALATKIRDFSNIGLREQSTVTMLQPYTDRPVYHAADPVLLLEKKDYEPFIGNDRLIKEPYLVMYLADSSSLLDKAIDYVARKRRLKIVHICGFKKKCKCDYFLKSTGPKELLNLIYYSDFVVSASFHATVFSVLLHKQFCTLLPEVGTNTRIEDVLSYFGLEKRIIRQVNDLENLDTDTKFERADEIRENLVETSKHILLSSLKK